MVTYALYTQNAPNNEYRKSSNYSAKKNNSDLRVALVLERKKLR